MGGLTISPGTDLTKLDKEELHTWIEEHRADNEAKPPLYHIWQSVVVYMSYLDAGKMYSRAIVGENQDEDDFEISNPSVKESLDR